MDSPTLPTLNIYTNPDRSSSDDDESSTYLYWEPEEDITLEPNPLWDDGPSLSAMLAAQGSRQRSQPRPPQPVPLALPQASPAVATGLLESSSRRVMDPVRRELQPEPLVREAAVTSIQRIQQPASQPQAKMHERVGRQQSRASTFSGGFFAKLTNKVINMLKKYLRGNGKDHKEGGKPPGGGKDPGTGQGGAGTTV